MRILFTFMCVLALSVMGCETTSTDGDGGTAGDGGSGGTAGAGGSGGVGGGVPTLCDGAEEWDPCAIGTGADGYCVVDECRLIQDCDDAPWAVCSDNYPEEPGVCADACVPLVESCTEQEYGTPCFAVLGWGICDDGVCSQEPDGE